jgi:hypothetical protein
MNENIINILDDINEIIKDEGKVSIYRNNKKILSTNKTGLSKISEDLQENFNNPSKNIKVYEIGFNINKNFKPTKWVHGPMYVNCFQLTLTTDLILKQMPDDKGQTITYTIEELQTIGFKMAHIPKIIKAIKNKTISFLPGKKVTITDVLNSIKPLKRITKKSNKKTSKKIKK